MPYTESASGYSGMTNSPFNQAEVMQLVSLKAEIASLTHLVAKAEYIDSPQYKGQSIYLMEEPDGIAWKPYEQNQPLVPDQVSPTGSCMVIDSSNYSSLKIDNAERRILGDNFDSFYEKVIDKTAAKLAPLYNRYVLGKQILAAPPTMRGNRAGIHGVINLGSLGNPLIINKDNITTFFSQLNTLFDNYGFSAEEKFLSVPMEINTILVNSPLASYARTGVEFGLLNAEYKTPDTVMGFNLIPNNTVQATHDPSKNELIHYFVFGCTRATAFGGTVIEAEESKLVNGFGSLFKFQEVHGGKVIHPDAIGVAVVKFDYS